MENQGAVAFILLLEYKPLRKLDNYASFVGIFGHVWGLCSHNMKNYAEHFFSLTN
jgi:hypothetical protein